MSDPKARPNIEPYRFKPGQSGNPSGKPKGAFSQDQIRAKITVWMSEKIEVLESKLKGGNISGLDAMIISVIISAVKSGDFTKLNGLLDRTAGKVKDEIEQTIKKFDDKDLEAIPREALVKLVSGE